MRLILKALGAAFGVLALAAFMGAAIGLGAEVIHWIETGTWEVGQTLADAWPALPERIAALKWAGRATHRSMGFGPVTYFGLCSTCGRLAAPVVPRCGA